MALVKKVELYRASLTNLTLVKLTLVRNGSLHGQILEILAFPFVFWWLDDKLRLDLSLLLEQPTKLERSW